MSIIDSAEYRALTGDDTSTDDEVSDAIAEAQGLIEEALKRPLDEATRTEECLVQTSGRLFPLATPISSVSSPANATIVNQQYIETRGVSMLVEPFNCTTDYSTVTYIGGYTTSTAPRTLKRAVASLALAIRSAGTPTGTYPVGATSISLGDASVSFTDPIGVGGDPTLDAYVPGLWQRIKRYRRRV